MPDDRPLSYRDAGVDRDAADRAKGRIAELVAATATDDVLSTVGAFGGLFRAPTGLQDGVLVASADGVGTKLKVAMMAGRHEPVGRDLVNHCVDDVLVEGARPLFFMDYIGMGRLEEGTAEALVTGFSIACRENGCALLGGETAEMPDFYAPGECDGGETAEMPDFYAPGEYDVAGFIVGVVENEQRPGSHRVRDGDVLLGLASDGFHTNGYTLLRRLFFERMGLHVDDAFPGTGEPLGDVLLRVHRSYLAPVWPLIQEGRVAALAHITGGGIPGNLARVIPDGLAARIDTASWEVPEPFVVVEREGKVVRDEMFRTFNMGVGMILVVRPTVAEAVLDAVRQAGETAWVVGEVGRGEGVHIS